MKRRVRRQNIIILYREYKKEITNIVKHVSERYKRRSYRLERSLSYSFNKSKVQFLNEFIGQKGTLVVVHYGGVRIL